MDVGSLTTTLGAIVGAIVGGLGSIGAAYISSRLLREKLEKKVTYNDKIKELTKSLTKASTDADQILEEMAKIIQERQTAVTILEQKQTELKKFVDSLEHGPAETLKIYQEIMEEQAKKQDREGRKLARNYFIYGSLVTLVLTVIATLVTLYIHL